MKKVDMWPTVNRVSKYGYTGMLWKRLDRWGTIWSGY